MPLNQPIPQQNLSRQTVRRDPTIVAKLLERRHQRPWLHIACASSSIWHANAG